MSLDKRVSVDTLLSNSFFVNMTKISIWENFQPNLSSFKLFCSDLAWSTDECFYAWFSWGVLHYFFQVFSKHTPTTKPPFSTPVHICSKCITKILQTLGARCREECEQKLFSFSCSCFKFNITFSGCLSVFLSVCFICMPVCLPAFKLSGSLSNRFDLKCFSLLFRTILAS
jgi:hypothetical protein